LEDLLKDFKSTKNGLDKAEVESIAEHDKLIQLKTTEKATKEAELEKTQKLKATKVQEISGKSGDLSSVSATLLDDQEYLKKVAETCGTKAGEWKERSQCRQDELSALTQAIAIIKGTVSDKTTEKTVRFIQRHASLGGALEVASSDDDMEAIEVSAEQDDSKTAFLQLRGAAKRHLQNILQTPTTDESDKRAQVVSLLRSKGQSLKSTLLASLAGQVAADPFVKIRKLIQELIERLLQEAADEANHKGWCDKEMSHAKQTRDYAAEEIETLNGELATAEALRDKLNEEIRVLEEELAELKSELEKATKIRTNEKEENTATIEEAEEGQKAVKQAIDVLTEFYNKAAEGSAALVQANNPEIPDAGFEGSYKGKQAEGGGILGMLDVILGDFVRTIRETTKAETKAAQEFMEFERESKISIATKTTAKEDRDRRLENTEEKLSSDQESIRSQQETLNNAIIEQQELHKACVDTGMSYEDRAALREQEIGSLKEALCILDTMGPVQTEGC